MNTTKLLLLSVILSAAMAQCKNDDHVTPAPTDTTKTSVKHNVLTNEAGKIIPATTGCYTGVAIWTVEKDASLLDAADALAGKKHTLVMWFHHWADDYDKDFNTDACNSMYNKGAVPYLSWCPASDNGGVDQPDYKLTAITAGDHDAYITKFAQDCKAWGKPLFLRLGFEMNADFFAWSGNVNGNNNGGDFVDAWKHVHDIFTSLQVKNVTWVWAPNVESLWDWGPMDNYYPGDDYVDWVGMDGYGYNSANWAHDRSKTFELTFSSTYDILKAHNKPIMVAEIGVGEDSADANFKPNWTTDAFTQMQNQYPLIKAYTWFDYNKEEDWRINSSNASLNAYKTSIQNQYFVGR